MSANYHAYQNRGFFFDGYEVIAAQWRERFTGFSPERIAGILKLPFDEKYLYVSYYKEEYRLRLCDGVLEKKIKEASAPQPETGHAKIGRIFRQEASEEENPGKENSEKENPGKEATVWTDHIYFNESMAIYHLLYYTKDAPALSGRFIPAEEAEGAGGRKNAPDPLISGFAEKFTGKCAKLSKACQALDGKNLGKGDVGYEIAATPEIHLRMIYWDADEDFPAQVQILVDENITNYMHPETIGCYISDLFEKLEERK